MFQEVQLETKVVFFFLNRGMYQSPLLDTKAIISNEQSCCLLNPDQVKILHRNLGAYTSTEKLS